MAVGCVQHYSTHFIKKLGKSFEPFSHKVKNCQKGPTKAKNWAQNDDFSLFVTFHFWSIFIHFEQQQKI